MQSFIIHIVLIIFYCVVFCLAITKVRWFRDSGIKPSALLLFFGMRVAAGWLHNLVAYQYFPGRGDIWIYFNDSFIARWELFNDVQLFLTDNFIWAYMPHNTIVLINMLLNFLSFDNLYINTLFFSFFVFWGSITLFRCINSIYRNNLLCAVLVLILPSTLFWTACIYTEGLLYFALGFFYYHLHRLLTVGWNNKQGALCIFFAGMVLFFRPNVFATLAPAAVFWIWTESGLSGYRLSGSGPSGYRRFGKYIIRSVLILLAGVILLCIIRPALPMKVMEGVLRVASERQKTFQSLTGHSRIWLPVLEPSAGSFLRVLPAAVFNGFFQPLPGSGGKTIYLLFSVELMLVWAIVVFALFRRFILHKGSGALYKGSGDAVLAGGRAEEAGSRFSWSSVFFAISGMLIIGFTVPFIGAIVRYRSIYLPFLLIPFIKMLQEWPPVKRSNKWLSDHIIRPIYP